MRAGEVGAEWSWSAGQVTTCDASAKIDVHGVSGIHVIARCGCGASFMSTDAGVALGMAQAHDKETHRE